MSRAQVRAGVRPGSTVLVMGSGISGCLTIRLALSGAGRGGAFATRREQLPLLDWARRSGRRWRSMRSRPAIDHRSCSAKPTAVTLADLVSSAPVPPVTTAGPACLDNGATLVIFAVPAPGQDHPRPGRPLAPRSDGADRSWRCASRPRDSARLDSERARARVGRPSSRTGCRSSERRQDSRWSRTLSPTA